MTTATTPTGRAPARAAEIVLRVAAAAGLAYDAFAHLQLAGNYDAISGAISQGTLFRIEAALAAVAAVLVLLWRSRIAALLAFLVAAGGLAALLLYRYVDVGPLGPLPNMYEPIWYPVKAWTAIAMGVAAIAALALLVGPRRGRRHRLR